MVFAQRTALIFVVAFLVLVGCTGNGGQAPTSPSLPDQFTAQMNPAADNHRMLWEYGEVTIDAETGTAKVVPMRTAEFNVNIVKFLQPPIGNAANLAVTIDMANSSIPNAYVEVDCKLSHPFPGMQYWGFDTRAIVFSGGSTTGKHDGTVKYPSSTELRMVNADGYTRWWNHDEFGPMDKIFGYTNGKMSPNYTTNWSKVNGYKYFANGITSNQMPPNPDIATRGSFSNGNVTRRMKLQFPKVAQPFKFKYSIDTSYENPTTNPPTSVNDFPPQANTEEAYQVVVTQDPTSTAFFNPDDQTYGGDLKLSIEVWDWKQGGGTVENEIAGVWVESPTLLNNQGGVIKISDTWTVTPGSTANSIIYTGTLSNVAPTAVEDQELFVTVESSTPTTYEPPVPGFLFPDAALAAYQLFPATILDTGTPPVKSITVTYPNGGEILVIGESANITWTWTGAITNVVIEYSTDSGATYPNVIVASTPCSGTYQWNPIPDTPTTTAKVRITEAGPTPEAQDESDADFTISAQAVTGWNPVPGMIGMTVDNPAPNQSTATPDLGIQNDNAGAEGAWMVDQQGGIAEGSPLFYDYKLDWSAPGGHAYSSRFTYNFCPMGRHDVSNNGIVIAGCSANENQMNPPVVNDPFTAIWYLSYLKADETAAAGDLHYATWGDQGTTDPPVDDPDVEPWFRTVDVSGGMPGQAGDPLANSVIFLMPYSHLAGAPAIAEDDSGNLNIGFWQYPFLTSGHIYSLPFPDYTTDELPAPIFEAFDVSDAGNCRIGADTDSYLTFDSALEGTATMVYMLDSLGNWYGTGFQIDWTAGQFYYMPLVNSLKIRVEDAEFYIDGATAVDLEMLPTITVLEGGDYTLDKNWCAVLFDDNAGNFIVRVYRVDWSAAAGEELSIVDTTDPLPGTPIALDVDYINFRIHVLAKVGSTFKATVFQYTP
jgi:hypothetical protein